MQCASCGKTGFVIVSGKRFCSNCGAKVSGPAGPATMSDVKPAGKPLDLRQSQTAVTSSAPKPTANARPAGQLHGQQVGGSRVLDLRASTPKAVTPAPEPVKVEVPEPTPVKPEVLEVAPTPPAAPTGASLDHVVGTAPAPKAEDSPPPPPAPEPKPEPEFKPTPQPEPVATPQSVVTKSPLVSKLPEHPSLAQPKEVMPSAVTTQIEDLRNKAATAPPPPSPPQSPALQEALAAAKQSASVPKAVKFGAAISAVVLMAGVLWMQNSPKLAFRNSAVQAGINATLPTYIPSSFQRAGDPTVASGQISMSYKNDNDELKIVQRRSNWDSNSLRENFINKETDSFLAVQGQGLTIFLYNDKATWVNHGVWYQLSGTSKLSREQILKIAYGL